MKIYCDFKTFIKTNAITRNDVTINCFSRKPNLLTVYYHIFNLFPVINLFPAIKNNI